MNKFNKNFAMSTISIFNFNNLNLIINIMNFYKIRINYKEIRRGFILKHN